MTHNDSYVTQLLPITHEIFEALDYNPFLDQSFDKIWHYNLLYKLKSMGNFIIFLETTSLVDFKGLF